MRDTFLRFVSDEDRNMLYEVMKRNDKESSYRAKIILLRDKGYRLPEIRKKATNHHDITTSENGYIDSMNMALRESLLKFTNIDHSR